MVRLTAFLVLTGASALALALLWARPFSWSQLSLFLFAALTLVLSLGPVRRGLRKLLDGTEQQAPIAFDDLKRRPVRLMLISLWLGLVVSLAEIALRTFEDLGGKRVLGLDYLWSIPVGYLIPLSLVGAIGVLVCRRGSPRSAIQVVVGVVAFVAGLGWLTAVVKGLHITAAATFAAGLAVQSARVAARHPQALLRAVRRTFVVSAVAVLVIAGGAIGWPRFVESRTMAALPAPPPGAPNVLLIVLDTVRAKSLGLYGYERATSPSLDRFAQGGVVFSHAFSTSPWTLPSHGSMFTGRLPHELTGAWMTPMDDTHPTVAEALSSAGYLTAGFIANTTYCPAEFGLARGFTHYEDHLPSITRSLLTTSFGMVVSKNLSLPERHRFGLKKAERVNGDFLRWIDRRDTRRPFFAFLNFYDAHAPYLSPAEFASRFRSPAPRGDIWSRKLDEWAPAEIRELNDAYDASIAYLDHRLGELLEELRGRQLLQNTVVIITADHGEQFGEHGLLEHANSLYLPLLHVPLIIVGPGEVPAARRIESFVSLQDLPSTVLHLTGQQATGSFPGTSLARFWSGTADVVGAETPFVAEVDPAYDAYPNSYPARQGPMQSLFAGTFHYIRNEGSKREELYDLAADFAESRDRSAADPQLLQQHRALLDQLSRKVAGRR